MSADPKATAINAAAKKVISEVRPIRDLSRTTITPVSVNKGTGEPIFMHANTVAFRNDDTEDLKAAWETARDALDAAFAS